jgi:8-oxo-dGTP pyrophosphatase MutT (NUDIX family)
VATPIGFEPTISTLTGWRVRPGYTTGPRLPVRIGYRLGKMPHPRARPTRSAGPAPPRRPNEVSAGGVLVRPAAGGGREVALVRVGQRWSLPKGLVEAGETPEMAALREVAEECGVDPSRLRLGAALPPSDYVYRREGRLIFKHVDHFLIQAPAGTPLVPQAAEVDAAEWMTFDEALERASYRDTAAALRRARDLSEGR